MKKLIVIVLSVLFLLGLITSKISCRLGVPIASSDQNPPVATEV